jgi:hypothetical protein
MQFAAIVTIPDSLSPNTPAKNHPAVTEVSMAASTCAVAEMASNGPRFAVIGGQFAPSLGAELAGLGWRVIVNPDSDGRPVPALRLAMRSLPLVDAFWLHCGHACQSDSASKPCAPVSGEVFPRMAKAYETGRLKLGRIVVPVIQGKESWPWLVDIGFRQPFVELPDDGDPWAVVEANRSQVIGVST